MRRCTVNLYYGSESRSLEVDESRILGIIEPRHVKPGKSIDDIIRESLINPIGCMRIRDCVKPNMTVAIISEDNTRVCPVDRILPYVLAELKEKGVKRENIKIIMALGTHRPMTKEEVENKLGKDIVEEYEVINHMWKNQDELVEIGLTDPGVPVKVNKHVLEADFKIGIGNVIPLRVSGYSGGAKIIQPGVCGAEITGETHWKAALIPIEEMLGVVENPVRWEMEHIATKVGLNAIINTVLNRDREVVNVVFGSHINGFREAVKTVDSIYKFKLEEKADVVVVDSHPADLDMWQAVKALFPAALAVKRGGIIVFLTPCPEGVSREHPEVEKLGYQPIPVVKKMVEDGSIDDLIAAAHIVMVREVLDRAKCIIVSDGLSGSLAYKLGFDYADDLQEAVDEALKEKTDGKLLIMRMGAELALS
ncbi:nickel-dependent lactate racemase [Candidatus Bathyarchaeota archaeon]|nr:nickel-dependent lactate racemase [Candidatus Bathyarchaeota archaeon]